MLYALNIYRASVGHTPIQHGIAYGIPPPVNKLSIFFMVLFCILRFIHAMHKSTHKRFHFNFNSCSEETKTFQRKNGKERNAHKKKTLSELLRLFIDEDKINSPKKKEKEKPFLPQLRIKGREKKKSNTRVIQTHSQAQVQIYIFTRLLASISTGAAQSAFLSEGGHLIKRPI